MEINAFINEKINPSITIEQILDKNKKNEMIRVANTLCQEILLLTVNEKLPRSCAIKNRTRTSLKAIWEIWDKVKRQDEKNNCYHQIQQGKDLYYATQKAKLPEPAAIPFRSNQALGFSKELPKGGPIDGKLIQNIIEDIKQLNIRAEFGTNSLSTGKDILTWIFWGNAVGLSFKDSGKSNVYFIEKYGNTIRRILRSAAPDKIDIEENNNTVIFIMEWD